MLGNLRVQQLVIGRERSSHKRLGRDTIKTFEVRKFCIAQVGPILIGERQECQKKRVDESRGQKRGTYEETALLGLRMEGEGQEPKRVSSLQKQRFLDSPRRKGCQHLDF